MESVVQKQPSLVARLNSEFSTGQGKEKGEEKIAPKTPLLTVRKPCEINVSPPKSPDKSFSHSIINLLSPSGSSPESSKGLPSRTAEHPFRPEVSDEDDEEDDSPTRKTPPSATQKKTKLKKDKIKKTTLSSDLLLSDE